MSAAAINRDRKDIHPSVRDRTDSKSRDDKGSRLSPNRQSDTIHRDARRDGGRDRDRRRSPPKGVVSNRSLPYERDPREMSPYSRGADSRRDRDIRRDASRDRDRRGSSRDRSRFGDRARDGGRDDKPRYGDPMDASDYRRDPASLKRPDRPPAPAPITAASLPATKAPYDAAVISMDPSLVPFAEMVEQRLQQACPMVTHIIVLKEEAHVAPCVDDLTKKGVLYAVILNRVNEQHQSCTLRMLIGTPQEHRNMPLHAAMDLVAHHFDAYLSAIREKKLEEPAKDFSRAPPGFVPPSNRIIYLLNLLADCRMLTVNELEELEDFIKIRKEKLIEVEGGGPPTKRAHLDSAVEAIGPAAPGHHPYPGIKPNAPGVNNPPSAMPSGRDEKAILAHQAELQAKILNILNPGSASLPTSTANSINESRGPVSRNPAADSSQIQKALDTLMSTGAIKDPAGSASNSPQKMPIRPPLNAPSESIRPQSQNSIYPGSRPQGGYDAPESYYGGNADSSDGYSRDMSRGHEPRPSYQEGFHARPSQPEGYGPRPGGPPRPVGPEGYQSVRPGHHEGYPGPPGPRSTGPEGFHGARPQGPDSQQAPRQSAPRFQNADNFSGGPGGFSGGGDNFPPPGPRHPNPRANAPEGYNQGGPRPAGNFSNYGQAGYTQGYGSQSGNFPGGGYQQGGGHYSGYNEGGQYGGRGAPPRMRMPGPPGQPGGPMQNRPRF